MAVAVCGSAFGQTFGFHLIDPGPDYRRAEPGGLSADGRVVGCWAERRIPPGRALSAALLVPNVGARVDFSETNTEYIDTTMRGVSGNGLIGVGSVGYSSSRPAVPTRFDSATGEALELGLIGGYTQGSAWGADETGNVIVGNCTRLLELFFEESVAFRWTPQQGMRALSALSPFDEYVEATAVSRDGRVTVGMCTDAQAFTTKPVKWIDNNFPIQLPFVPGLEEVAGVQGVSANGDWIVGLSGGVAAVWGPDGGVTRLWGPGYSERGGYAWGVSDDGQVIVGYAGRTGNIFDAFVWASTTEGMLLQDYLSSHGVSVPTGVRLEIAYDVSADGRTFSGRAMVNGLRQTFVATIPAPATLVLLSAVLMFPSRRRSP